MALRCRTTYHAFNLSRLAADDNKAVKHFCILIHAAKWGSNVQFTTLHEELFDNC